MTIKEKQEKMIKSKEAIKRIKKVADYIAQSNAWDIRDELYKCCDNIEKDLEVLEIIRNHTPSIMRLKLCNTVEQYNKIYIDNSPLQKRILNEYKFKLLKEWLNENS